MQKIFTILIALFIVYSLAQERLFNVAKKVDSDTKKETVENSVLTDTLIASPDQNSNNVNIVEPIAEPQGNFVEKTLSRVANNMLKTEDGRIFFEHMIQPLNQNIIADNSTCKISSDDYMNLYFRIKSFDKGETGPATCGHIVDVHYQIISLDNTLIEESDKTFTLGFKPIIPGLDAIIVGMTIGETRHAVLPPPYAYQQEAYRKNKVNPEGYYKINVRLNNIVSTKIIKSDEVRIFDDQISTSAPLLCGDTVNFNLKITRLATGDVLFDSIKDKQKINYHIGDNNYPLILSYSLNGKTPIGSRVVITKGKNFENLNNTKDIFSFSSNLNENEYLMLELTDFNL